MSDDQTPVNELPPSGDQPAEPAPPEQTPPERSAPPQAPPAEPPEVVDEAPAAPETPALDEDLGSRLERLGGEPAPDITPEEFARLQQAGQIHIDPRGRVRATLRDETDAGISLRKRRAWYAA